MEETPQIHVARKAVQLGVFTAAQIVEGLANGRFLPTDLAWTNGMAGWKALAAWPDFAASAVPASPVEEGAAPVATSVIPWEQGKTPASFFATVKGALLNPRETLTGGRFAFGDWLVFCYVALVLTLPFQLFALFAFGSKNHQIAELLKKFGADEVAEQILASPEPPVVMTAFLIVFSLGFAPMSYALNGLFQWLGMKLFRLSGSLERTVAATLLASALLLLLAAPLQLLGFSLLLQIGVGLLFGVPLAIVYYRSLGAATGTGAWTQFGISCLIGFIVCCCCCVLPIVLMGGLGAFVAAAR